MATSILKSIRMCVTGILPKNQPENETLRSLSILQHQYAESLYGLQSTHNVCSSTEYNFGNHAVVGKSRVNERRPPL